MKRKTGFYWVTIDGKRWRVAHWIANEKAWYITGSEMTFIDAEFKQTDEQQITRNNSI